MMLALVLFVTSCPALLTVCLINSGKKKNRGAQKDKSHDGDGPHPPQEKGAVAATNDPNYKTLAAVDGNCFDKKQAPRAPTDGGGVAATHDPNYQTLAAVPNAFDKKE
ncbi:unnamed protein product [Bursaphelenchus xylophilus]|uniref:(pine wood nematode) hypothetical protein n=1 Tax=Bursaphelenchus xylophilus TaxID=6326 RepID=A0A1I7SM19_BURXY|nr:unnamed protein product [Bursaphelenchus xylophilus]CAG9129965.1 unnamed protein product [Bursaphelenchus xylophilus]